MTRDEATTGLLARTLTPSGRRTGEQETLEGSSARLAATRRRARRTGLLVAPLLMLAGASGAVYLASAQSGQVDVVALARPVAHGDVITAADLATVRVTAEGGRVRLSTPASARRDLVAKAALVDLPAGMLMTPELVAAATPPATGVAVGVRLSADALPAPTLRPGETVRVVRADPASGHAQVITSQATVLSVTSAAGISGDQDTVAYLSVPPDDAADVAGAASTKDGVRLLGVRP